MCVFKKGDKVTLNYGDHTEQVTVVGDVNETWVAVRKAKGAMPFIVSKKIVTKNIKDDV